ncbi:MAG: hypothetical protein HY961_16390 [Ignavibacteriae bacterium]|nr:hypothetical protein [Ignavibacteriota bacterium]
MAQKDPTLAVDYAREFSITERSVEETAAIESVREEFQEEPEQIEMEATQAPAKAAPPIPTPIPIPIPIPIPVRTVSGRYRGTAGVYQLELRVDVDRTRPLKKISGDFYQTIGGTTTYFGSWVVNSPAVTATTTKITIKGATSGTFATGAPIVQVSIMRRSAILPPAPAIVQFFTTGGSPGAMYLCTFESTLFRRIRIETDRASDVTTPIFTNYNTGSLPSGGPARNLNVVSAYAEAGIEMIPTTGSNVINIAEAGTNARWSNAELHNAMMRNFTLWRDQPQWAVWQFVAQLHDMGSGLYGIMFDQAGKQRQGCAVFHAGIGGTTADKLRLQLYTYVHELGHCFNLLHSWQKSYAVPPSPNRPLALSWMNYPWYYPSGGAGAFWSNFPFQFDAEELMHLRHGFRNKVIMGGNNFTVGSALGRDIMADPLRDDSQLSFNITTHQKSFALGEPVVLQLTLGTTDARSHNVHTWLHPNYGLTKVAIQKPDGKVITYEPLIDHLVGLQERVIGRDALVQDSAYIGYGKDGFYFDLPGYYRIRAAYAALDGSEVLSEMITVRVRYPVTAQDEELADMFMGEDQGALLYLLGSDSEFLSNGNAVFDEVLAKHPKHPLTNYVRLLKGVNASRDFKNIVDPKEGQVIVRRASLDESAKLLTAVADTGIVDPVSVRMSLSKLAEAQSSHGDDESAAKTFSKLSSIGLRTKP